jgi:hypothetical protein
MFVGLAEMQSSIDLALHFPDSVDKKTHLLYIAIYSAEQA